MTSEIKETSLLKSEVLDKGVLSILRPIYSTNTMGLMSYVFTDVFVVIH